MVLVNKKEKVIIMVLNSDLKITRNQAIALYNALENLAGDCDADGIGYSSLAYAYQVINTIRKANGIEQETSLVFDDDEVLV